MPAGPVAVTGGTGYTGRRLLHRLATTGVAMRVLVRPTSDRGVLPPQAQVVAGDLEDPASTAPALRGARVVYHLAHVRFTPAVLAGLDRGVERVVVVSSLRALSRVRCPTVSQVLAGEAAVRRCPAPWTILRPSMIFGPGDDGNISRLAARLRRSPWLPVPGARRRHQPVFVEDVIDAILACPESPVAAGRTYAVAGARPLTGVALVVAVGAAVGVRPHPIPVPDAVTAAAAALLGVAEGIGLEPPIRSQQVRRLLEDKAVDIGPARRDLGLHPLAFEAALGRIYDAAGSS